MRASRSCAIIRLSFTSEIAAAVFPSGFCDRGALPSNGIRSCLLAGAFFFGKLTQQKSLDWSNRRRLSLPNQMATQGSLSVSKKEEVVNKVIL